MSLPLVPHRTATSTFVVLDTETTGFYYDAGDEIIELAAEKLVGREVVAAFHALIKPMRRVPPEATAIHGLTDADLARDGQAAAEVFPAFARFTADSVLVGHNIRRFDFPFLVAHYARLDLAIPANDLLDTLDLARQQLYLPNYKLGTVANHFGISTSGAHRATADVAMTRQVLLRLLEQS